uniref:Uncharacterized protein n=1 Tax=uncultured marine virus TaxID=186617 RepID=S4TDV2_9VIRU|nr:hypothetical protein [uncultured marine virus]
MLAYLLGRAQRAVLQRVLSGGVGPRKQSHPTAVKQAERNVFLDKEEKYFKANGALDKQIFPEVTTTGAKTTSVIGWGTTGVNDGAGALMTYCGHNLYNLQMLNPFLNSELNAQLRPNVMEGKRAVPTKSTVNWTINRNYVRNGLSTIFGDGTVGINAPPSVAVNDSQLYQNLPIRCRMVRVTPKLSPGINTQIDPTNDLFLDQLGLAYSPASTQWTVTDNEFARVNTRKYTVLGDTKFTLGQPITATWALNSQIETATPDASFWRQDLIVPEKPVLKRITTNHQLTTKKGGEVYFDTGSAGTMDNATAGSRREYVIMHFWYESGDGGTVPGDGGASIPNLIASGLVPDATAVKVHFRVESRFREP